MDIIGIQKVECKYIMGIKYKTNRVKIQTLGIQHVEWHYEYCK